MTHKVTVNVSIEIEVPESWSKDCKLEQVYRQANEYALHAVNHAIKASKLKARIIEKPIATITVVQERKGGAA